MSHRICLALGCIVLLTSSRKSNEVFARQIASSISGSDQSQVIVVSQLPDTHTSAQLKVKVLDDDDDDAGTGKVAQVERTRETRRINPFKMLTINSKPRVSPLYLINGTVCRFINFQPVCTTLSTTGLTVGPGGTPASGGGAGGGGGAARPATSGAAGGGAGGGAGATGSRPATSGVSAGSGGGGSSVQFANQQPTRNVAAAVMSPSEQPEVFVERRDNATDGQRIINSPATSPLIVTRPRLGVVLRRRRPLRPFLPLRPITVPQVQYQLQMTEQKNRDEKASPKTETTNQIMKMKI